MSSDYKTSSHRVAISASATLAERRPSGLQDSISISLGMYGAQLPHEGDEDFDNYLFII